MKHVFWLMPHRLGGRPGPDRAAWNLASLRREGVGAVLSVNDGFLCHPEDFRAHDIAYACCPLSDSAPPREGDEDRCLAALPAAHAFVTSSLHEGRTTIVHCASGKDRTGLYLAYFLMKSGGLTPRAAFKKVREVRPIAFSAVGWDEFAMRVLESVE